MKEQKHTPGPWEISKKFPTHIYKWKDKNTFYIVATCDSHGKTEIDLANAELIARAPELLEQVATLQAEMEHYKNECYQENSELSGRIKKLEETLGYVKSNLQGAIDCSYSPEEAEQTAAKCIEEITEALNDKP